MTYGEDNSAKSHKLGKSILGHGWDPKNDTISIGSRPKDFLIAIHKGTDGLPSVLFTPRILFGIVNKPHDLLGLMSPSPYA